MPAEGTTKLSKQTHEDDVPILLEALTAGLSSKSLSETEARLRRFDGQYRWFRIGFAPLLDEAGKIVRWCGTSIDIHDLKEAEARIRRDVFDRGNGQSIPKRPKLCCQWRTC